MAEMTHMTPAQTRSELAGVIRTATEAMELLDLYEDVYADEISEEVARLMRLIGVKGHVLRKQHLAAHQRDAAFADAVNADLDRLKVVAGDPDKHEDWDEWLNDWHEGDDK